MTKPGWLQLVRDGQVTQECAAAVAACHHFMQRQTSEYHIDGGPVINFDALAKIRRTNEYEILLIAHNNNEYAYAIKLSPESVGKLLWAWHCWCYANGRQCLTE